MNGMLAIYLRSVLLVLGFAAFLLVEVLASPPHAASETAQPAAVGSGQARA
jgi:hypothetical protein